MTDEGLKRYRAARNLDKERPAEPRRVVSHESGRFLAKCAYCGRRNGRQVLETAGQALAWLSAHEATDQHKHAVQSWGQETEEDRVLQAIFFRQRD